MFFSFHNSPIDIQFANMAQTLNKIKVSDRPRLVYMRGLPRSGKSTLAEMVSKEIPNSVIICGDDFRLATYGQTYIRLAEPCVSQSVLTSVRALLMRCTVIFDETNSSEWSLRRIYEIDRGAIMIPVSTPKEKCLEINRRTKSIPLCVFDKVEYQLLNINPFAIQRSISL